MPRQDVSIARHFAGLPDPRVNRTRQHRLGDILVIALCAVVCGADSWEEVERFGEAKKDWLSPGPHSPFGIGPTCGGPAVRRRSSTGTVVGSQCRQA